MFHCLTFSCRCSTLHVSAYMAIFRCVWCFTFIFLKESASLFLLPFLARGYTLHVSICIFLLCFSLIFLFLCVCVFACLLRQLNVRQWNIYNKAARRRQHNLKTWKIMFEHFTPNFRLDYWQKYPLKRGIFLYSTVVTIRNIQQQFS
jgi:hypothetical protein